MYSKLRFSLVPTFIKKDGGIRRLPDVHDPTVVFLTKPPKPPSGNGTLLINHFVRVYLPPARADAWRLF